jgi:hypothetical protein
MKRTMGKTVVILLVIMLVASSMSLLLAQAQGEDPANLVVNPGFENGLTGWGTTEGPSALYSVDSTTYHSGTHSCKGVEDDSEALGRLYQDVTSITSPGNQYQISGWIKRSDVTAGAVVIGLDYVDAYGWTPEDGYVKEIGHVSGTLGWTFFQSDWFTLPSMPEDASALWFLFDFNAGVGTAWFDDVSLICKGVIVPPGENVIVHPDPTDPRVSLTFEKITTSGTATLDKTAAPPPGVPPLLGIKGLYYDFEVTFSFTGTVEVGIPYDDTGLASKSECRLGLWHYEPVAGDVNGDGKVNWKDILIIASALGTRSGNRRWNPACDLNSDGKVDLNDLCIALRNFGKRSPAWVNITTRIDTVHNIIYGATRLFSIFGVR